MESGEWSWGRTSWVGPSSPGLGPDPWPSRCPAAWGWPDGARWSCGAYWVAMGMRAERERENIHQMRAISITEMESWEWSGGRSSWVGPSSPGLGPDPWPSRCPAAWGWPGGARWSCGAYWVAMGMRAERERENIHQMRAISITEMESWEWSGGRSSWAGPSSPGLGPDPWPSRCPAAWGWPGGARWSCDVYWVAMGTRAEREHSSDGGYYRKGVVYQLNTHLQSDAPTTYSRTAPFGIINLHP